MIAITSWSVDPGTVLTGLAALVGAVGTFAVGKRLKRETTPNGGSSMRDAVNRIELVAASLVEGQAELRAGQAVNGERLKEHDRRLTDLVADIRHLTSRIDHRQDNHQ